MEVREPGGLAEVRTLAGDLVVQPLLREVVLWSGGEGEGVLFVVFGDEVFDYGAGFPEGDAGVGIFDGGDAGSGVVSMFC